MSQTVLFEIGAVIFVAVSTAVFLYGLTIFRDWQDRDDTRESRGDELPRRTDASALTTCDRATAMRRPFDCGMSSTSMASSA